MGTFADIKSDVRATRRIPLLDEEETMGWCAAPSRVAMEKPQAGADPCVVGSAISRRELSGVSVPTPTPLNPSKCLRVFHRTLFPQRF